MRHPRPLLARALAVLLLAGGLVPLTAGASWGCSCVFDPRSEAERWTETARTAPVVYVARVAASEQVEGSQVRYAVDVLRSVKGSLLGSRTLTTSSQGSACGVVLPVGSRVLVTSTGSVGLCGGATTERVDERVAIARSALAAPTTVRTVLAGETLGDVARTELRRQSGREPSAGQVVYARRVLETANRRLPLGTLRPGTRLLVPRLT